LTPLGVIAKNFAVLSLALGALDSAAVEIVVDSFDRRDQEVGIQHNAVNSQASGVVASSAALGGYRRLELESADEATGGTASASIGGPSSGLAINNTSDMFSKTTVTWDALGIGLDDVGAGDITGGSPKGRLLVGLLDPLIGTMLLRFELVHGDPAPTSATAHIETEIPDGYAGGTVELPFADFTVGTGFDWTSLFSITMIVTSPDDGFSTVIRYVKAVPVPATLPILVLGLMAMVLAGKQSHRR